MDKFGYECSFENSQFKLSINPNIVGTGALMVFDNIYFLYNIISYNETLNVESPDTKCKINSAKSRLLWHKRLGHISKNRVEQIVLDGILDSIDFSDYNICC